MIGILKTGFPPKKLGERFGNYPQMLDRLLRRFNPAIRTRTYNVVTGRFPKFIDECDAYLITGSQYGAYDDTPWISKLKSFIRKSADKEKKMAGICFGHQIIAHSLGGRAEKSDKGIGAGLRRFKVARLKPWMSPPLKECSLYFCHQDQVRKLPAGAEALGGDDFCPHQMYSMGGFIFCMQGHPEFSRGLTLGFLNHFRHRLGRARHRVAAESLSGASSHEAAGRWLANFLA